jgi:hypothetical protein
MKTLNYYLKVIDYVYYRTFHWYKNKKDSMPGVMAASIVMLLIFLTLLIIEICLSIALSFSIPEIPKWIIAVFLLSGLWFIMYRYSKISISTLDLHWKNEKPKKKTRRGWLIFLFLVGELLFIIISSYIRHNVYGDAEFFK